MTVSAEQLAAIKEQLKSELMAEMQKDKLQLIQASSKPWDEVKATMLPRLGKFNTYEAYQITTAVSTIIRHSFGIGHVKYLSVEQLPKAQRMVVALLDEMVG